MNKLFIYFSILLLISCKSSYDSESTLQTVNKDNSGSQIVVAAFYRGYCKTDKKYLNRSWNSDKKVAKNDNAAHKRKNPSHKTVIKTKN